ncbi:MAG: glycosyltransferase family 2 protein [Litorilinea sp.]
MSQVSTSPSPFFTVVIPTHNRSGMVAETIASVLAQTWTDFEVLVVDDHSTDDTEAVVTAFNDPRVRYLRNARARGACGARNTGIFQARGTWVAPLDDDDWWLPGFLQAVAAKIATVDRSVGVIYSGHTYVRDGVAGYVKVPNQAGWALDRFLYRNLVGFSSVVIRRDYLWAVNGLDERFPAQQDGELFIRLAHFCQIDYVPESLACIRVDHGTQITTNWRKKLDGCTLLLEKHGHLYARSPQLMHRAHSRIILYGVRARDWAAVRGSLLWFCAGIFVDPRNVLRVLRFLAR